ncbi:MAG: hypothetical protein WA888_20505, partial [Burkholderiaceae bacterium]
NRAVLQPGETVFANVRIALQSGTSFDLPVTVQRPSSSIGNSAGSLGPIYVLVVDADDPDANPVAQGMVVQPQNGTYTYTVDRVPGTQRIVVVAGSDTDNDGFICNTGEACGAYPVLGQQAKILEPRANLTGIDFSVAPFGGIAPETLSAAIRNTGGLGFPVNVPTGRTGIRRQY